MKQQETHCFSGLQLSYHELMHWLIMLNRCLNIQFHQFFSNSHKLFQNCDNLYLMAFCNSKQKVLLDNNICWETKKKNSLLIYNLINNLCRLNTIKQPNTKPPQILISSELL